MHAIAHVPYPQLTSLQNNLHIASPHYQYHGNPDYIDYTKEHTNSLFIKQEILTVFNLYPYHCLLELYKILKFRTPYCILKCIFEHFTLLPNETGRSLTLTLPIYKLRCQNICLSNTTILEQNT